MRLDNDSRESGTKVAVAIAFIATYTSLIFTIPSILPSDQTTLLGVVIYTIFVVFGVLIDLFFFLYLVFRALELTSVEKKETFFDISLKETQVIKAQNFFFDYGVRIIFLSFSAPVIGMPVYVEIFFPLPYHLAGLSAAVLVGVLYEVTAVLSARNNA